MLSLLEEEVQTRETYVLYLFHIRVRLTTVWYVVFSAFSAAKSAV